MKNRNCLIVFVVMIAASFMVSAAEIYEKKGKQGNVEFSDQDSPGAKAIEVNKPNVVRLEPGKPAETAPATPATKAAKQPVNQPEVVYGGGDYDDESRNRLHHEELERERKEERKEHRADAEQQPVHREGVKKGAVHQGGGGGRH